jgi:hypothetical protein
MRRIPNLTQPAKPQERSRNGPKLGVDRGSTTFLCFFALFCLDMLDSSQGDKPAHWRLLEGSELSLSLSAVLLLLLASFLVFFLLSFLALHRGSSQASFFWVLVAAKPLCWLSLGGFVLIARWVASATTAQHIVSTGYLCSYSSSSNVLLPVALCNSFILPQLAIFQTGWPFAEDSDHQNLALLSRQHILTFHSQSIIPASSAADCPANPSSCSQ